MVGWGQKVLVVRWRSFFPLLVFTVRQGYGAAERPKLYRTNALLTIDLAGSMLENCRFWPQSCK